MKYDFETLANRREQGSVKYRKTFMEFPNLPSDTIPLSTADMEFKNPPEMVEGLKKFLDDMVLGYTEANEDFKEALKSWLKRVHDFEIKDDWIVNNTAVVPAIFNAIKSLTNEGDGVIVMSPVYFPFFSAVTSQGRKLVDAPLIEKDNRFYIDFEKFEELAKKKENKVILFCSPHNPVTRVWTREELEKLEKIILENDLYLISDEIHSDIIMPGHKHIVFQTLSDKLADRTITFTSASKTFNLAGMGVSTTIIKNPELKKNFIQAVMGVQSHANSALGFKAAEICYNECEEWLGQLIEKIIENQNVLKEELKDTKIKIVEPEGTYLMFLDFRAYDMTREERERTLAEDCAVIFDHGHKFGEVADGFERINLAAPTEVIRDAARRLKKYFN